MKTDIHTGKEVELIIKIPVKFDTLLMSIQFRNVTYESVHNQ